ncbi:Serine/threonine protein kinase [Trema orientale]|uniref:non-specific serine/threonine protein kinase n=1 Tax=Trema orientale TaxID=63057 RepID=A0A2P5B0Y0_TREOI|nr:Serine/threonine protein kinase [Trema orientale]
MILQNHANYSAFWPMFLSFILIFSMNLLLMNPTSIIASAMGNETDRFALLKFKDSISNDPYGVLRSWNDSSINFCNWPGIACSRRHQRVTSLNLEDCTLRGTISPYIGNLSFLRVVNLGNNKFYGEIPPQVGHLFRLQRLNLSINMLEGEIPANLSYCSNLTVLILALNNLSGVIPLELGSTEKLSVLYLGGNNLTGGIPPSLGNISSLTRVDLARNNLVGSIPHELGRLKSLIRFLLWSNFLYGTIPPSLYNISSLSEFIITENQFRGTLPPNIGLTLPNIKVFAIGGNNFSGMIPESFSNASKLQSFDIGQNSFVGKVPSNLGNLPDLSIFSLKDNMLGSHLANSLDFIASLTNCSKLKILSLTENNFGGVIPKHVANLSTQLTRFYLGGNQVSGNIPATLENLVNLTALGLDYNLFTGVIPSSLGKLPNLQLLALNWNALSGKIPSSIGNLTKIFGLTLPGNKLEGSIPSDIANCKKLQTFDISDNSLSGTIPKELFGPSSSFILVNLSRNSLIGSIPVEVSNLKNIYALDLSENNLTSEIPETIGDCESLEFLYLQGNFFQSTLPSSLASLKGLRYLDLSQNKLFGKIPNDLQNLHVLLYLNLSFNDLEGEVPNKGVFQNTSAISIVGNTKLCGGVPKLQLPPCPIKASKKQQNTSRLKLTIIVVCAAAFSLSFLSFLIFYWRRKSTSTSSSAPSTISFLSKVSYKSLYQATNGFSQSMLIGTGSFGSVYKGIIDEEESPIAVKVFNLQQKGASKSFIAECNALRNVRHRNLVKILTCCSSMDFNNNDFKALVFEYMSNGSLEKWLHPVTSYENQSMSLNLIQRLNVVADVATAIHYLHDHCDQPIIHCDLKPSNVLLDNDMIAHVGDFGLARLMLNTNGLSESQSSTIGIKGTIGYAPPGTHLALISHKFCAYI